MLNCSTGVSVAGCWAVGSPTFGELEVRLEPPVEVSGWLSSPVADQPVKQCSRARAEQCELWEVGGIAHACRQRGRGGEGS